jgi:hypothetical protein
VGDGLAPVTDPPLSRALLSICWLVVHVPSRAHIWKVTDIQEIKVPDLKSKSGSF